jgi:hypothetical protein
MAFLTEIIEEITAYLFRIDHENTSSIGGKRYLYLVLFSNPVYIIRTGSE